MEKKSIIEYRESIERFASDSSELVFDNSGIDHAAVVLSTIFKYSEDTIRIYAHNMNGEISSQECYKDSIENFINSSKKLMIAVDKPENLSETIKKYLANKCSNVEVKIANESFKRELISSSKDKILHHFAVGDKKMIRVELDSQSHKALCSFNLPKTSNTLINIFDKHYKNFETVSLA